MEAPQMMLGVMLLASLLLTGCLDEEEAGLPTPTPSDDVLSGIPDLLTSAVPCDLLSGADQAHCWQKQAIRSGNPSFCAHIIAPDSAFFGVGSEEEVTAASARNKCFNELALKTGSLETCANIAFSAGGYDKDICYTNVAEKTRNIFACDRLGEYGPSQAGYVYSKDNCVESITQSLLTHGCTGMEEKYMTVCKRSLIVARGELDPSNPCSAFPKDDIDYDRCLDEQNAQSGAE